MLIVRITVQRKITVLNSLKKMYQRNIKYVKSIANLTIKNYQGSGAIETRII